MHQTLLLPTRSGPHRMTAASRSATTDPILSLQATAGNRAVQQWLRSDPAVQRDAKAPNLGLRGSPEEIGGRSTYRALERNRLRDHLYDLVVAGEKRYLAYRRAIQKATAVERQAALNPVLLSELAPVLGGRSFERCAELLGRRAPSFDDLRRDPTVREAIAAAWAASDVGVNDAVTQAHEEGGWVYLNLIDASLSVRRATPQYTDAIQIEPAPAPGPNEILVATFHTHPHLGPRARPSRHDLRHDARRGVPNLVAGNPGSDPDQFQIFLSGPAARRHLSSDTVFPGASGGIPP